MKYFTIRLVGTAIFLLALGYMVTGISDSYRAFLRLSHVTLLRPAQSDFVYCRFLDPPPNAADILPGIQSAPGSAGIYEATLNGQSAGHFAYICDAVYA